MINLHAQTIARHMIPVIDITPLRAGRNAERVAKALHRASQELGFIYIKGHGIPDRVITAAYHCALEFFRASSSAKATVAVTDYHRGWLASGAARMQDDVKPDLKESFIWGTEADQSLEQHPFISGTNRWPPFLPQLQPAALDYFSYAHEVAVALMRGFALGLGLDEDFFLRSCSQPLSRASFVYYPSQAMSQIKSKNTHQDQFGVGPHTDFGVLTLLCQDAVGGLQIQSMDGKWIHAPPIEGALIINVGDLLARWTDGAYRSTPHRVVNQSGQERLSIVLAFDPDTTTLIDSRQIFGTHHVPKHPPIHCGDYLTWRFGKAFSYLKPSC